MFEEENMSQNGYKYKLRTKEILKDLIIRFNTGQLKFKLLF